MWKIIYTDRKIKTSYGLALIADIVLTDTTLKKIKEYYKDDEQVMNQFAIMQMFFEEQNKELEVRTLEYVEEECKKIVEQLILLEKEVER